MALFKPFTTSSGNREVFFVGALKKTTAMGSSFSNFAGFLYKVPSQATTQYTYSCGADLLTWYPTAITDLTIASYKFESALLIKFSNN